MVMVLPVGGLLISFVKHKLPRLTFENNTFVFKMYLMIFIFLKKCEFILLGNNVVNIGLK